MIPDLRQNGVYVTAGDCAALLPKHAGNHEPHVDRLSVLNTHTHTHTHAAKIMRSSIKGKTIVAILYFVF